MGKCDGILCSGEHNKYFDAAAEPRRIIVRAGAVVEGGRDLSPCVLPEHAVLAAQQRWQDG